jgi:hypothetical protein
VDINPSIMLRCKGRLGRRFMPGVGSPLGDAGNGGGGRRGGGGGGIPAGGTQQGSLTGRGRGTIDGSFLHQGPMGHQI